MLGKVHSLIAAIVLVAIMVGFEPTSAGALTFNVSSDCSTMMLSGTVLGAPLEPASWSSDMAARLTGTLEVLLDDPANPTRLSIASGRLDVTKNTAEGKFLPGPGGTGVPAYADFAFTADAAGDLVELALRELLISLSTDGMLSLSGPASAARFDANLIDTSVSAGFADVRSSGLGGSRIDLTGLVAEPTIDETGILDTSGDVYELMFVYQRTIDLSDQIPDTVLTVWGAFMAEGVNDVPEPSNMTILVSGAIGLLFCAWRRVGRLTWTVFG
jgi:hypothetical protein